MRIELNSHYLSYMTVLKISENVQAITQGVWHMDHRVKMKCERAASLRLRLKVAALTNLHANSNSTAVFLVVLGCLVVCLFVSRQIFSV